MFQLQQLFRREKKGKEKSEHSASAFGLPCAGATWLASPKGEPGRSTLRGVGRSMREPIDLLQQLSPAHPTTARLHGVVPPQPPVRGEHLVIPTPRARRALALFRGSPLRRAAACGSSWAQCTGRHGPRHRPKPPACHSAQASVPRCGPRGRPVPVAARRPSPSHRT